MSSVLIGPKPYQVPTNADLGSMAYQNKEAVQIDYLSLGDTGISQSPLIGMTNQLVNVNTVLRFENKPTTIESVRAVSLYGLTKYSPGLNSAAVVSGGYLDTVYPATIDNGDANSYTLTTLNGFSATSTNMAAGKIGTVQGVTGGATNWYTTNAVVNNITTAAGGQFSYTNNGYGTTAYAMGANINGNISSLNSALQPAIWLVGARIACTNNSGNGAAVANVPIGVGAHIYTTLAGTNASTIVDGFGIAISQAQGTAGTYGQPLTPVGGTAVGPAVQGTSVGTVTNAYGIYVGKVYGQTKQYGLYLDTLSGPGATKYTIYSADTAAPAQINGPVIIGTATASSAIALEVSSGFTVIGNNNLPSMPTGRTGGGCAFSWNYNAGNGETNIYNLYYSGSAGALSFVFSNMLTTTTKQDILKLYKDGNVKVEGDLNAKSYSSSRTGISTASYTVLSTDYMLYNTVATTLTLPSAGKILIIKNVGAFSCVSASANVIPQAGGTAVVNILAATSGKWAMIQSNGTNWEIMMSN
jgi:hypothetical protein